MIKLSHVCKRYPNGHEALKDISFDLASGEMAFLAGHSGAGKSTLFKLITRIEKPTSGQVIVDNQNLGRLPNSKIPALFDETTGSRGDAVSGTITNRRIFDIAGADITSDVLTRIETSEGITLRSYPTATFKVGPGVMDDNGEILGEVNSYYTDGTGAIQEFETGNYYAIVSGNNAKRIVGVVVLENSVDPIADTVRDTSGFIVYR